MSGKLSKSMSTTQFDNGYWYLDELKVFAKDIGISSSSKLRKDQLEKSIKHFLRTGKILSTPNTGSKTDTIKDSDKGLSKRLQIRNYKNNKETKNFIVSEAKKMDPDLKERSGARYRLNRWREEQIEKGVKLTYGDLIKHYIKLNKTEGKFKKIPHGRYINFISDYMKNERAAKRQDATKAWDKLKTLDIPKTYYSWIKYKNA